MHEPIDSIQPTCWLVWHDWCLEHDDPEGAARARRIAETLASGRTGLWLLFRDGACRDCRLSNAHRCIDGFCIARKPGEGEYLWAPSLPFDAPRNLFQPIKPVGRAAAFARRPDLVRAFFDKLCDLGPFLLLDPSNPTVAVPRAVAVCPECNGELEADVFEWDAATGEPTELVELVCCAEDDYGQWQRTHRSRQSVWQPVRDAVEHWARDHVRVRVKEVTTHDD